MFVVRPVGRCIDAAINDSSSSRSSSGHGLLTQSSSGQGQVRQTLQYTTIDVPGADKANGPMQLQATGGASRSGRAA